MADHDADLDWAAGEGGDEEEWECVACGKSFRTEAAWNSHERSKKHLRAVEALKREMELEDAALDLGADGDVDGLDDDAPPECGLEEEPAVVEGSARPAETDTDGEAAEAEPSLAPRKGRRKRGRDRSARVPSPDPTISKTERRAQRRNSDEVHSVNGMTSGSEPTNDVGSVSQMPSKREQRRVREAAKKLGQIVQFVSNLYCMCSCILLTCNGRGVMFAVKSLVAKLSYLGIYKLCLVMLLQQITHPVQSRENKV